MTDPLANLNISLAGVNPTVAPQGKRRYLLKYIAPNEFALQIDNSSLEVFNTCPRSAEYQLVHARGAPPSPPLTYGGGVHDGLEYWYKNQGGATSPSTLEDVIRDSIRASEHSFEQNPIPLGEWRTADKCSDTLQRYFKHYGTKEPFELLKDADGNSAVEIPFSLPLGVIEQAEIVTTDYTFADIVDPDTYSHPSTAKVAFSKIHVYWTGKMDLAARMDGANWIIDHKTTSMLGPSFYRHFELSGQTIGYTWAGEQIFGEKFAGLMVNVIVGRKPTKSGVGCTFERQRFYYRQDQVDEWADNTLTLCSDFIACLARDNFPMSVSWCMGKYGACKYHDVCTLPKDQRHFMLNSDQYADNTWTPLHK